jgi:hypothetical protein
MSHIVLAGDSIFDNRSYIGAADPDVVEQVNALLPADSRASLLAVDGSVTSDVRAQLLRMPQDASHIVVSVGGNDALGHMDILTQHAQSVAEVYSRVAALAEQFERDYRRMLEAVLQHGRPTAFCTIYFPSFPDPELQRLAVAGLATFNDCILRAAIGHGLPVLDLRLICNQPTDYANPIEPSVAGGEKIARVICAVIAGHDFSTRRCAVYV